MCLRQVGLSQLEVKSFAPTLGRLSVTPSRIFAQRNVCVFGKRWRRTRFFVKLPRVAVQSRYLVGIDLGTTHTVVAYADTTKGTAKSPPPVEIFAVDQLVAPGEVDALEVLPSIRFHASEAALPANARVLPWGTTKVGGEADAAVVGRFASTLGEKVPNRLVSSAKSWLSHGAVDRTAPILPWGAPESSEKVSPVFASASYLSHIRDAWDAKMERPLSTQEVVLTVPASFDEASRALTLQAAKLAGLKVRLVEEPQAAFYRWLDTYRDTLEDALGSARLALVVDVGGGTTDLTLLKVELRESGPRLTRIAVGDHLMLGGDNMDLALAKKAEASLGKQLSAARFSQLVRECRRAKELLLSDSAPESVTVNILGSSSKLVGGTQQATLTRDEVRAIALDGFFPEVELSAVPTKRGGIMEFGLPYVADAGITRHVAAFLRRHENLAKDALLAEDARSPAPKTLTNFVPDAVLFNGGVFQADALRDRMRGVLSAFRGSEVALLENDAPDLAVAHGAVAYGLARRGVGLKIGGGSARSYFLMVDKAKSSPDDEDSAKSMGVCVLPRGAEEGEEIELGKRTFSLRLGRPVRFHVVTSTSDVKHIAPGELVNVDDAERYKALPPIAAVLEGKDGDKAELPVRLSAALTEIGTLEMSCISVDEPERRWKMELQLRGASHKDAVAHKVRQLHPKFADASARVKLFYGKSKGKVQGDVKRLRAELEKMLGPRESWDTPLLREIFGALLAGLKRRRRSADHERMWFHLVGYTLRPGFGFPLDEWRVKELLPVLQQGLQFVPDAQNWSEYWTMWRRVSGGIPEKAQHQLLDQIEYYLRPPSKTPRPRPSGPKMLGVDAMIRLAGTLEHLSVERKTQVGGWLVERLDKHDEHPQSWWAVGRLGARVPAYGSAHKVVPPNVATQWLDRALSFDFRDAPEAAFAATLISRVSGDRQRDLDEAVRQIVARRLAECDAPQSWQTMVLEVLHLDAADERKLFGDSMPPGLRLID